MTRDVHIIADGFSLLEGPRWRDGRLYVSDFYTHRVLSFAPDGTYKTLAEVEGQPSGLGWGPDGRLLISSMTDQKLLRLEGDGGLTEVADLSEYATGFINDMVVDAEGSAYIGSWGDLDNLGKTQLVRVDPTGTATNTGGDVYFPNGACFTPDGKTLLLAETFLARISAFDVLDDGSLANRRVWAQLAETVDATDVAEAATALPILPDGICLDAEGCLWVACAKSHGAYRVREGGEILEKVEVGEQTVFALALGGDDGSTLYLCCAAPVMTIDHASSHESTLRACRVDVPAAGHDV